jgi:hypothetical protein
MAEILVRLVNGSCDDARANPLRGMPVVVQPDGHEWGKCEGPPEYVVVKIPGVSPDEVRGYCQSCPIPQARPMLPRRTKYTLTRAIDETRRCGRPFPSISAIDKNSPWRRRRYRVGDDIIRLAESQSKENVTLPQFVSGLADQSKR